MTYNRTILLVEDNADDEALVRHALERTGVPCDLVVVRDGIDALDFLFARGEHTGRDTRVMPRIVIMDMKMPRLDGKRVVEIIRKDDRTRLVPIVILSLSVRDQEIVECYRLGANSFVRKAMEFSQFVETMKQVLHYWLVLNEAPPV